MRTKIAADPAKLAALTRRLRRTARGAGEALSLHARLRMALLGGINAGDWTAGDRLPTEAELAAATDLSLGTVQRALRTLTDEGVVRRRQGSGSFVAPSHHRIDDVAHARFLDDDGETVLPLFSQVLSRRPWRRAGPWSAYFSSPGVRLLRLDRVLSVNGEFDVFSRFFFDGQRFKGLASRPLGELAGTNFKVLLRQESNVPPGGLRQTLQMIAAPRDIASRIDVSPGSAVTSIEIVRYAGGGDDVVYFQQMFVPPSSRKLVTHPAM